MLLWAILSSAISAAPEPLAMAQRAVDLHRSCQKNRAQAVCIQASFAYRAYFELGARDARDAALHFFWGELFYDRFEDHAEAKRQYELSLTLDPTGRYAQPAAYNAMLAADQLVRRAKAAGTLEQPRLRDLKEPVAIPPLEAALVEAADRYRTRFPGADRVPEASYRAAKVFYDYNHIEAAVARFSEIAERYPRAEAGLAEVAANLVIDAYSLNQDWVQLLGWARRFHARAELGSPNFRDDLVRTIASTDIKVRGLKGREAAAVLRAAVSQATQTLGREQLLEDAAKYDRDFGPLADLRLKKLEGDPTPVDLEEAASTLHRAGRADEAEALYRWADWLRAYEEEAAPPKEGEGEHEEACSLTVEE